MSLPTDSATRKTIALFRGLMVYFPDALAAVAQCSVIANEQHNPGEELRWNKRKSTDELDAMLRHLLDGIDEDRDDDGLVHAVKRSWRSLADLQRRADRGENIFWEPPEQQEVVDETITDRVSL